MGVHQQSAHRFQHLRRRDRVATVVPMVVLWSIFVAMATVAITTLVPEGGAQAYAMGAVHAGLTVLAFIGERFLHHVLTTPDAQLALLREELVADGQITPPVSLYRTW